jgi:hypothetical protein
LRFARLLENEAAEPAEGIQPMQNVGGVEALPRGHPLENNLRLVLNRCGETFPANGALHGGCLFPFRHSSRL